MASLFSALPTWQRHSTPLSATQARAAGLATGGCAVVVVATTPSPLEAAAAWLTTVVPRHGRGGDRGPISLGASVRLPPLPDNADDVDDEAAPVPVSLSPLPGVVRDASGLTITCAALEARTTHPALRFAALTALVAQLEGATVCVGCRLALRWAGERRPWVATVAATRSAAGVESAGAGGSGAFGAVTLQQRLAGLSFVRVTSCTHLVLQPRAAAAAAASGAASSTPKQSLSPWKSGPALSYSPTASPLLPSPALPPPCSPLPPPPQTPHSVSAANDDDSDDEVEEGGSGFAASAVIAGLDAPLAALRELVLLPLLRPRGFGALGLDPPRGVLLHGPPGCGKTLLVRALADEAAAALALARTRRLRRLPSRPLRRPPPDPLVRVFSVQGPEALSGRAMGEGERRLRAVFAAAAEHARGPRGNSCSDQEREAEGPRLALVFLDEVDALCPRRANVGARAADTGTNSPAVARLVTQLLTLMDGLTSPDSRGAGHGRIVVVGATNRPDSIDPALRRPGRFDREIRLGVPDAAARLAILELHSRRLPLDAGARLALPALAAQRLAGFVGADLHMLCREAALAAMARERRAGAGAAADAGAASVTAADFDAALLHVAPSALRGLSTLLAMDDMQAQTQGGDGAWAAVGGMAATVARLREAVEAPLLHHGAGTGLSASARSPAAALYRRMGLSSPRGILLHGPPGNSKTTLARALALSCGCGSGRFFALSGAELLSAYVGESERALREIFARAREAAPALLFLDEVDALVGGRGGIGGSGAGGGVEGGGATSGVLATLLTEMDGVQDAAGDGVIIVAATNRPEALDPALLRPGRLELHVAVGPPLGAEAVAAVLRVHTRRMPLGSDVDLGAVARALVAASDTAAAAEAGARAGGDCHAWSGAALEGLCAEAAMEALREDLGARSVALRHWKAAVRTLRGCELVACA